MAEPLIGTMRQAQLRRRPELFLSVMGSIFAGLHLYVWLRWTPLMPEKWSWIVLLFMVLGAVAFCTTMFRRVRGIGSPSYLAWLGFPWAGILFLAFSLTLLSEPLRLLLPLNELGIAFSGGLLLLVGGGFWSARHPQLSRIQVPIPGLSENLRGFSIIQLSDVHVGHTIDRSFLETLVERVNAESADLVVITGDLVDGTVEELKEVVEPLRKLHAAKGVFFVTGNHEYFSGGPQWVAHLQHLGIKVLRNEWCAISTGLDLVGVDDLFGGMAPGHGMDLERAFTGKDPSVPAILLAHQPVVAHQLHSYPVALMLSGHTHGGQLYPFHHLVRLVQPWLSGLQQIGNTKVYVHRGTGYWGPPLRIGAPGEIARIELIPQ